MNITNHYTKLANPARQGPGKTLTTGSPVRGKQWKEVRNEDHY